MKKKMKVKMIGTTKNEGRRRKAKLRDPIIEFECLYI